MATKQRATSEKKADGGVLRVDKGRTYRGARKAWYDRLVKFDGKPLAKFIDSVTVDRPSVYGKNSEHSGEPEPVAGWVRFFFREGVAKTTQQRR